MSGTSSDEIKAIIGSLAHSPTILEGFLNAVPSGELAQTRGNDFWSIHEHAAHLADVQPMVLERIQRILSEDIPEFVPFIPEEDTDEMSVLPPVEDILIRFRSGRDKQLALLKSAGPAAWRRKAIHPEYDQYGLLILARHILMHDHWHMYRMEELWLTKDAYLTRLEG